MMFEKINVSIVDSIGRIEMNSPKNLNAFDEVMGKEVREALNELDNNNDVRVIVLSGKGKGFSAGGDIGYFYNEVKKGEVDLAGKVKAIGMLSVDIKKASKPVIASVHGGVAGAAFNIALACDFCIASNDAKFIQAFVNLGLVPDAAGAYLLTRAIGVNKAAELMLNGTPVGANEAKELGIVTKVVEPEELEVETMKYAKRLANGPTISYKNIKRLIFASEYKGIEEFMDLEDELQTECAKTEDFREAILAFVEKRRANFTGK